MTSCDKNVLITFFTVLVTTYETLHYHDIVHCLQGFETHVSCLPLSAAGWGSPRGAKQPSNTNMPWLDNIYRVLLISAHSILSSAKSFLECPQFNLCPTLPTIQTTNWSDAFRNRTRMSTCKHLVYGINLFALDSSFILGFQPSPQSFNGNSENHIAQILEKLVSFVFNQRT